MKNITVRKEMYDYCFQQMQFFITRKLSNIKTLHYWTNNRQNIHHIFLRNGNKTLRISISLRKKFSLPEATVLRNNSNWSVTLPEEYDASYFIHELIFSRHGKKPAVPISTFIGISPDSERRIQIEFRKKVKRLTICLACEVEKGILTYDTAATHFSAVTGLRVENARRLFRRFQTYS